jgi:basic membrane lipoprotein Med (substrate-binding protein (PBP1-ABC) superfamily)
MARRRVLGKPSWALAIAALGGCSLITNSELGNGIGEACTDSTDCQAGECDAVTLTCTASCAAADECPAGSACVEGKCRIAAGPCIGPEDCAIGTTCENGVCVPAGELTVGEPCSETAQCAATLQCVDGLCTKTCASEADCPVPSNCFDNLCQLPLAVAAIFVGVPEDEGWTLTHKLGLDDAVAALPYLTYTYAENKFISEDISATADDFVGEGADVVVANSFSQRFEMESAAEKYPDVQFLTCSSNVTGPNLGSYFARSYQAWYLAGYAAAQKTTTNRLGFVGSYVTPEVVRHINAFTRGAQKLKPTIKVEVLWEGFWFDLCDPGDTCRETVLTQYLMDTDCDVIAHNSDVGRTVEAVELAHTGGMEVYSVGNDNIDACDRGPNSCIGTAYWNWGPMYVSLFDQIHRKVWDPTVIVNDNIKVDPQQSVTNFAMNDNVVEESLKLSVANLRGQLAKDEGITTVFEGPYATTGQRAAVEAGETISDAELTTMCWFVKGVFTKAIPGDPMSADLDAKVPDGTIVINPDESPDLHELPNCSDNQ